MIQDNKDFYFFLTVIFLCLMSVTMGIFKISKKGGIAWLPICILLILFFMFLA